MYVGWTRALAAGEHASGHPGRLSCDHRGPLVGLTLMSGGLLRHLAADLAVPIQSCCDRQVLLVGVFHSSLYDQKIFTIFFVSRDSCMLPRRRVMMIFLGTRGRLAL